MASRLTLTVLLMSAVFGSGFGEMRRFRMLRAADPAPAARPAPAAQSAPAPSQPADKDASIVQQHMDYDPASNSFSYMFETTNGIKASGSAKDNTVRQEGSFIMYAEDGTPVEMTYVADENGYQVSGALVPQADPAIVKAVEYLKSLPPQPEEEEVEAAKAVKP